nr:translation initiation factor IF-2-like [Aegilops tauschii subsp. strangulata]
MDPPQASSPPWLRRTPHPRTPRRPDATVVAFAPQPRSLPEPALAQLQGPDEAPTTPPLLPLRPGPHHRAGSPVALPLTRQPRRPTPAHRAAVAATCVSPALVRSRCPSPAPARALASSAPAAAPRPPPPPRSRALPALRAALAPHARVPRLARPCRALRLPLYRAPARASSPARNGTPTRAQRSCWSAPGSSHPRPTGVRRARPAHATVQATPAPTAR